MHMFGNNKIKFTYPHCEKTGGKEWCEKHLIAKQHDETNKQTNLKK